MYDEINWFIKILLKIRHSVSYDEWCDKICDKIKYLISKKSGITNSINHNFTILRIDSYDSRDIS